MSRRLTADDVRVNRYGSETPDLMALVQGQRREYVVDFFSGQWFCTCRITTAHAATECAHIRATKEALNDHAS